MGSGGIAPLFLDLSTRWRCVVSFITQQSFTPTRGRTHSTHVLEPVWALEAVWMRRLTKNLLGIKTHSSILQAVTILTELSYLPYRNVKSNRSTKSMVQEHTQEVDSYLAEKIILITVTPGQFETLLFKISRYFKL
jgi:hypothetical protein